MEAKLVKVNYQRLKFVEEKDVLVSKYYNLNSYELSSDFFEAYDMDYNNYCKER